MERIIVVGTRVRFELLTVGETFQDLIFAGLPRLPRAGEELKTARYVETVGGGAAITAVAAARLGLRTATITAAAPGAIRQLRREGVAVTDLLGPGEPHAVTAALSTARDRAFATFPGINARLQPRLAEALGRRSAAHVHFAFAPDRCGVWTRIANGLRARGTTTSWDFGWAPALAGRAGFPALVASADFVFMNGVEARLYARAIRRARTAVVKLGRRGSRWISADAVYRAAASRVRVVDTTGAGDAFNAGFLCAFLRGRSPRACLKLGNLAGAQSTRALGGISGLPTGPIRCTRPTRPTFARLRHARASLGKP
jgi:sugar/nucleoside kinase (ribokinase family)